MTDRLSPADAGFLYIEDAGSPMHVGGVVVLEPTGPFDYNDVVRLIDARLGLVPRYRQKVAVVPGRFARPVWVDDPQFDLTYHVRRSALPRPGTDAQLSELISRLVSRPLDRRHPLWELYVVEGLAGGRVALINKTHLSMVDRVGAVDVAAAILDITAEPRPLPGAPVWIPMPPPSEIDLVVDAVADIANRPAEVVDAMRLASLDARTMVGDVGQLAGNFFTLVRRAIRPAPRSALDVIGSSGQRLFVGMQIGLDRIKDVRAVHGGTLNDVLVAVITGALRSFLLSRGEPVVPGTTIRAMMPISVRGAVGEQAEWAGSGSPAGGDARVTSYMLDLPVSEPNPVIRLHQVSFAMAAHSESDALVGADALMELGRFAPATLHTLGARVGAQLGRRTYNLMITNVPGPQIPLYAAGIPVVAMYPVAPLPKGQAIALSLTSYNGKVFFGLMADRAAVPDLEDFGTQLLEAVDEFRAQPTGTLQQADLHRRSKAARPAAPRSSPAARSIDHAAAAGSASSNGHAPGPAAAPRRKPRARPAPRPAPARPVPADGDDP